MRALKEPVLAKASEEMIGDAVVENSRRVQSREAAGAVAKLVDSRRIGIARSPLGEDCEQLGGVAVVRSLPADQDVAGAAAEELVLAVAADEDVAVRAAENEIVARVAEQVIPQKFLHLHNPRRLLAIVGVAIDALDAERVHFLL